MMSKIQSKIDDKISSGAGECIVGFFDSNEIDLVWDRLHAIKTPETINLREFSHENPLKSVIVEEDPDRLLLVAYVVNSNKMTSLDYTYMHDHPIATCIPPDAKLALAVLKRSTISRMIETNKNRKRNNNKLKYPALLFKK